MPACRTCNEFSDGACLAEDRSIEILGERGRPAPLSACPIPIVDGYLRLIKKGASVLEVGCGSWSRVRDHCVAVGAHYEGIDSNEGDGSVATRIENLADLSFDDGVFDFVIGTQSMEHWAEFGCSVEWGLYQCFRVCKTGGRVLMNVPIHFHGTADFMLGRRERLRELYSRFTDEVLFEEWGRDSDPLPPYFPYPGYLPLRRRPAYVLDIQAIRDKEPPSAFSNNARMGVLGKFQSKPFSYVIYSASCRLLGVPR